MRKLGIIAVAIGLIPAAGAQYVQQPEELAKINVVEKIGDQVPLALKFTDHDGNSVELRDYFSDGKPVVLTMAYYACPMLCTLVLNGLRDALAPLSLVPNVDYRLVTVSIEEKETPLLASQKRQAYLESFGRSEQEADWHFLVGSAENSRALADAIGFEYYYDAAIEEWAHPSLVTMLTPSGKVARYLYGISHESKDVQLAILESKKGETKITKPIERILLYCYRYDPDSKGYVLAAQNIMKAGGALTVLFLGLFLGTFWIRERRASA